MRNKKTLTLALALVFALNILLISVFQRAEAVTYQRGSAGSAVSQIQLRLKNWGYYGFSVNGLYNSRTETAVRAFQQRNSLRVNGLADSATLAKMGLPSSDIAASADADVKLLARLISAQAGDEPYRVQVAVGAVILNRLKHPSFPETLPGVIYQPGAFPCVRDGRFDRPLAESAVRAARDALLGVDPSGGALCYLGPDNAAGQAMSSKSPTIELGRYRFFT
ncbi:MAG: cell wall hydrolase [Firmicutes bacterium]|nr:cell wall hydrolase [Bacillota bacterium]